ncbi:MAG: FtsX-like permease family protein [Bacteroidota bacterium]
MLRNYIRTALRNFTKNKFFSLVNIAGLGLGIACAFTIYALLRYELTFDHFHEKGDRIYRIVKQYQGEEGLEYHAVSPYGLGDAVKNEGLDFEQVSHTHGPVSRKIIIEDPADRKVIRINGILFVDEHFLDIFDYEIIAGAGPEVLAEPNKVFLTETAARDAFGTTDVIGKSFLLYNDQLQEVVGVIKDPPTNTNLRIKALASLGTFRNRNPERFDDWSQIWESSVFVLLNDGRDPNGYDDQLKHVAIKHLGEVEGEKTSFHLQPLKGIHTDEFYINGPGYTVPSQMIIAEIFLAACILLTACINFINLATAQAVQRSKEVGIRKTLGGRKSELIKQFLFETACIVFMAILVGMTLSQILVIEINQFLSIVEYDLSFDWTILVFAAIIFVVVTLCAGFYPAYIISRYDPVTALKNKLALRKGSGNFNLRRLLIIGQFGFSNLLIISTVVFSSQLNFLEGQDKGFDEDNVFSVWLPTRTHAEALRSDLLNHRSVEGVTRSYAPPMVAYNSTTSFALRGESFKSGPGAFQKWIDEHYLETYKIPLLAGRNLSTQQSADSTVVNVLVNRTMVKDLEIDSPEAALGQEIRFGDDQYGRIIGVVEDFHMSSLKMAIQPCIMYYRPGGMNRLDLKLSTAEYAALIPQFEDIFRKYYPTDLFEYDVVADEVSKLHLAEKFLNEVLRFFAGIAIFIGILGLYGLVAFITNRNAKEIGIRKVMGAHVPSIIGIFAKEYGKLLVIAFILAAPLGYFAMKLWLQSYIYRIDLSLGYFLLSFIISLLIALFTVGYRSAKAALANPVDALRYE